MFPRPTRVLGLCVLGVGLGWGYGLWDGVEYSIPVTMFECVTRAWDVTGVFHAPSACHLCLCGMGLIGVRVAVGVEVGLA